MVNRYTNADSVRRLVDVPEGSELHQRLPLVERYQQRLLATGPATVTPSPPARLPADDRNWLGRPRRSAALQAHDRRMDRIHYVYREADEADVCAHALARRGIHRAIRTITDAERLALSTEPGSFAETFAETALLDLAERVRYATAVIYGYFLEEALGPR